MISRFAVRATCLLALSLPLFGQTGYMGLGIDKNLIFPDFVVGPNFTTQVVLMNPEAGLDVTGTLYFFNQDGAALTVNNNGSMVTQLSVTVPQGGTQFVSVGPAGTSLTVGWALFDVAPGTGSPDPRLRMFGSVIFTHVVGATTVGTVGVVVDPYEIGQPRVVAVPVVVQGSTNTGVAVVNAGAVAMNLTFQLKDATGAVVQQGATIVPPVSPLAPGNQFARFVTELFPGFNFGASFHGSLVVTTNQEGMVVTGLLANELLLTSIPVVQVPAVAQTFTVTNSGFAFSPSSLTISVGDSVQFVLDSIHDAVEVSQATWNADGNTPLPGGFSVPFGGGTITFTSPGVHYYVCAVHASLGMKGTITVQ